MEYFFPKDVDYDFLILVNSRNTGMFPPRDELLAALIRERRGEEKEQRPGKRLSGKGGRERETMNI